MSKRRSFIIKSWAKLALLCLAFWAMVGLAFCSKAQATPIDGVFKTIKQRMDIDASCKTPVVFYSDELILKLCQRYTLSGYRAMACFIHPSRAIILPTRCKTTLDGECMRLTRHELARAAYACQGIQFDNPVPDEILQMEDIDHE